MKKYAVVGTVFEEVKRQYVLSQLGGNPAFGLSMQGSMDVSQYVTEFVSEMDFQENEIKHR